MEIKEYLDFDFLIRFLEGLQKFLGDKCEIVIHDFRKGYDNSLVYAFNAELSGRHVGDSPRGGMITRLGEDIEPLNKSMEFFYSGQKEQFFRSCTTLIADGEGKIVGSVCLNMEISDFVMAQKTIHNFIHYPSEAQEQTSGASGDILTKNVDDILKHYIQQAQAAVGKPMALMSKEEKIKTLDYLDGKGVFKITKAGPLLCEEFKVSKYTLYNYLEEARKSRENK